MTMTILAAGIALGFLSVAARAPKVLMFGDERLGFSWGFLGLATNLTGGIIGGHSRDFI